MPQAAPPHQATPSPERPSGTFWRRLRWAGLVIIALLVLAVVVAIGANLVFGPGPDGLARLSQAMGPLQVPSAFIRGAFGLVVLAGWPHLVRMRAKKAGWSDRHLKTTLTRDRFFIGAAVVFDVFVLNLPLWLNLIRG